MTRYVIDTNVYVAADRDLAWAEELERFSTAYLPFIHFHAVVLRSYLPAPLIKDGRSSLRRASSNPLKGGEEFSSRASQLGKVQGAFCPNSSSGS
jgi:hypothetical protein